MRIPLNMIKNMVSKTVMLPEIGKLASKPASALECKAIAQSLGIMEQSRLAQLLGSLKANMVETFHLGKSALPEVVALEQKMQSMGVKVTFADNLETAKVITSAIEKVKAKGLSVPERVILMTPNAQNKGIRGWTSPHTDVVLFNKDLNVSKENSLPDFIKNMGIKPNATDTAEGVVFHEIGHRLQGKCPNAVKIWKEMTNSGFDASLAKEVGYYAMTGDKFNAGREFVAEVFAGLMSGKHYSKRVMKIYNALNGPQIPGVNMSGIDTVASSSLGIYDSFKSIQKPLSGRCDIFSSKLLPQKSNIFDVSVQKTSSKSFMSELTSLLKK